MNKTFFRKCLDSVTIVSDQQTGHVLHMAEERKKENLIGLGAEGGYREHLHGYVADVHQCHKGVRTLCCRENSLR